MTDRLNLTDCVIELNKVFNEKFSRRIKKRFRKIEKWDGLTKPVTFAIRFPLFTVSFKEVAEYFVADILHDVGHTSNLIVRESPSILLRRDPEGLMWLVLRTRIGVL